MPRPDTQIVVMSSRGASEPSPVAAVSRSPRPVGRLSDEAKLAREMAAARRSPWPRIDADGMVRRSGRPIWRDDIVLALSRSPRGEARGGGLCGRPSIQGEVIEPVPGRIRGCGIAEPVRVRGVAGLALSTPARMDCGTAQALEDWVRNGVVPAVGRAGGGAVELHVVAGYACRTRNNQRGARISEHGKGRAIDIAAIRLADGSEFNVLRDWGRGEAGRILRAVHRAACGPFGTVLGPESDRFHRDHFHFDTARYRAGTVCR